MKILPINPNKNNSDLEHIGSRSMILSANHYELNHLPLLNMINLNNKSNKNSVDLCPPLKEYSESTLNEEDLSEMSISQSIQSKDKQIMHQQQRQQSYRHNQHHPKLPDIAETDNENNDEWSCSEKNGFTENEDQTVIFLTDTESEDQTESDDESRSESETHSTSKSDHRSIRDSKQSDVESSSSVSMMSDDGLEHDYGEITISHSKKNKDCNVSMPSLPTDNNHQSDDDQASISNTSEPDHAKHLSLASNNEEIQDQIILHHAYKLMQLIPDSNDNEINLDINSSINDSLSLV